MGYVRRFARDDIPQVARLHETVFPPDTGHWRDSDAYHAYFRDVFLENPAGDPVLPSLVYEQPDGTIAGFLGIVRRRVTIGDCRYEAAVSSQFIVDPSARGGLVAVPLARAYLEGPQDLSVADEANEGARRIWEGVGGRTALLQSLYWTRALRPARLAMSFVRARRALAPLAMAASPIVSALDALATHVPGSHFRQAHRSEHVEDVSAQTVVAYAPEIHRNGTLWVEYDERTFQWLLDRAAARPGWILKAAFRHGLNVVGWYVCHIDEAGNAEAVQLTATPSAIDNVLDHLFYQAWRHGATAVTGRLDPRFMQVLSDRYCLFHRRGPWMLVHTRKPDILASFQTGNAAFSRLDGEWSLRL